ncbi:MAG: hypothetical protein ACI4EE_14335 [Lachnospiraceae bacterium]
MTKFEGCYLTNGGLAMVHDAGLGRITFTRAVTGSGTYESKDDIPELVALKEQKQEFGLEGYVVGENYNVDVEFKLNNIGLTEEYQLSEIGIYAKADDGEEKLYCVAFALPGNTKPVPAYDGGIAYQTSIVIETLVSTDANVSIIYSEDHKFTINYVKTIVGEIDVSADGTVADQMSQMKEKINSASTALNGLAFGISDNGCLTVTYDDGQ